MAPGLEEAAVAWSRSLNLFSGAAAVLGEGAGVLPLILISASIWLAVQFSMVPLLRLVAPSYVQAVERVASEKAKESNRETPEVAVKSAMNDIGVRSCAFIFSTILSYGALVLTLNPPPEFVKDPDFGSTAYATFYCALAAGYFVWDLPITVIFGYGGGFLMHAIGCLSVEVIGLHPFAQDVVTFAHLFELSTPFLNARLLMIASGHTNSVFFKFCEAGFALVFFCVRILYGFAKSFAFARRVVVDLLSGDTQVVARKGAAFVPIAVLAVVLCVALCGLNAFWFSKIIKMATGKKGSKHKKVE